MADILERLKSYNPPDRTIPGDLQMATDIHEAALEIERLRAAVKRLNTECDDLTEIAYPTTE